MRDLQLDVSSTAIWGLIPIDDPSTRLPTGGVLVAMDAITLHPVGLVASPLTDRSQAPRQGDEGAPTVRIVLNAIVHPAMEGLAVGDRVIVLTWLHEADRDTLVVHPRGDRSRPATGVFATRSPDRPNPIGLHEVTVLAIQGSTLTVAGLEAIDGTPVLDLKPALGSIDTR